MVGKGGSVTTLPGGWCRSYSGCCQGRFGTTCDMSYGYLLPVYLELGNIYRSSVASCSHVFCVRVTCVWQSGYHPGRCYMEGWGLERAYLADTGHGKLRRKGYSWAHTSTLNARSVGDMSCMQTLQASVCMIGRVLGTSTKPNCTAP